MIKTFAKIENGVVINTALAEDVWPFQDDPHVEIPAGVLAVPGWTYDGATFAAPVIQPVQFQPSLTTTPLQFIGRFTDAEQVAIATAAMQSPAIFLWFNKLTAAQQVVFADVQLAEGMAALVAYGLITQARSEEILPANVRSTGVTPL